MVNTELNKPKFLKVICIHFLFSCHWYVNVVFFPISFLKTNIFLCYKRTVIMRNRTQFF